MVHSRSVVVFSDKRQDDHPRKAHSGQVKHHSGCTKSVQGLPLGGLRYQSILPIGDVSMLPTSLITVIADCESHFITQDRGGTRHKNDAEFDRKAKHFSEWLAEFSIKQRVLSALSPGAAQKMMGAYLHALKCGNIRSGRSDVTDSTIRGYLRAAAAYLLHTFALTVPIFAKNDPLAKSDKLLPYFAEILAQRQLWKKPKEKKEPITGLMFDAIRDRIRQACGQQELFHIGRVYAVYDWTRLGLFTGSRLSEYGQGDLKAGHLWSIIPDSLDVPKEW